MVDGRVYFLRDLCSPRVCLGCVDEASDAEEYLDGIVHCVVDLHHFYRVYSECAIALCDAIAAGGLRGGIVSVSESVPDNGVSTRGTGEACIVPDELRRHFRGRRGIVGVWIAAYGRDWREGWMAVCLSGPVYMRYTNDACRWVYIIEGLFSVVCAVLIWFGLPNDPANAYFLNDEEKWMMRVRNEQRRAYMGSDEFSWTEMRIALTDPKLMFSSVTQFCQDILLYGFSTFLPTILQSIGYDSFMSNVLTVPVYLWAAICFIAVAILADRFSIFAWVCILLLIEIYAC